MFLSFIIAKHELRNFSLLLHRGWRLATVFFMAQRLEEVWQTSVLLSCSRLTPLTTSPGRAWEGELEEEDAARRDQQLGGQGERHGIPCLVSMPTMLATMVDLQRKLCNARDSGG